MARGGKRPGAGRKYGAANKATMEAKEKARSTGEMPLDYMLRVMRDEGTDFDTRNDMAKAAAPYLHSKMPTAIVLPPPPDAELTDDDDDIMNSYLGGLHAESEQN